MDAYNQLVRFLDKAFGFPNKIKSMVKKKGQFFDQRTGEHVFQLEYRIKVRPGIERMKEGLDADEPFVALRELMDVKFVHTEDTSPSPAPKKKAKRSTTRTAMVQKKIKPMQLEKPVRPIGE